MEMIFMVSIWTLLSLYVVVFGLLIYGEFKTSKEEFK